MNSWVPLFKWIESIILPSLPSIGVPRGMITASFAFLMVLGAGDHSRRTSRITASRYGSAASSSLSILARSRLVMVWTYMLGRSSSTAMSSSLSLS